MELKKTPKADLQNKRSLFLEIGLFISIGLMILAFNWGQSSQMVELIDTQIVAAEEQIIEITREPPKEITPRANINFQSEVLNLVPDDITITVDPKFNELDEDRPLIAPDGRNSEGGGDIGDEILSFASTMPKFQGGDVDKFHTWLQRQIGNNYPQAAKNSGIQGTVLVSYIIEVNGKLTNIEILSSPSPILSDAVVRILKTSPTWSPARQGHRAVRLNMQIPVEFKLT